MALETARAVARAAQTGCGALCSNNRAKWALTIGLDVHRLSHESLVVLFPGAVRPDLDPVGADERLLLLPLQPRDDEVGLLEGHVAVDAAALERVALLREELAALLLVAGEAPSRQLLRVALRLVHVVTGDARHLRLPITPASRQERHLIAMHVHRGGRRQLVEREEALERPAGDVREGGRDRL